MKSIDSGGIFGKWPGGHKGRPYKSVLVALLLAGCGGLKNTNPLLGLAGPADVSAYHFEADAMAWAKPGLGGCVDLVSQSTQASFFGAGSLMVHVAAMGPIGGTPAWIGVNPAVPPDLSNRTLRVFLYAEAASAPDDSKPSLAQIYLKDGASTFANGPGINLVRGGWTELSFAPIANATGTTITAGGAFIHHSFNPSAITEMGLKIGASGAAAGFSYTGSFFLDGVSW